MSQLTEHRWEDTLAPRNPRNTNCPREVAERVRERESRNKVLFQVFPSSSSHQNTAELWQLTWTPKQESHLKILPSGLAYLFPVKVIFDAMSCGCILPEGREEIWLISIAAKLVIELPQLLSSQNNWWNYWLPKSSLVSPCRFLSTHHYTLLNDFLKTFKIFAFIMCLVKKYQRDLISWLHVQYTYMKNGSCNL